MKKLALVLLLLLTLSSTALAYNKGTFVFVHRMYYPGDGYHALSYEDGAVETMGKFGWVEEPGWFCYRNNGDTVYRVGSDFCGDEVYTTSINEVNALSAMGWYYGAITFKSSGTLPIYRLYSPTAQQHLYTADENEYNALANLGWNQEGIAFYGVPVNEVY